MKWVFFFLLTKVAIEATSPRELAAARSYVGLPGNGGLWCWCTFYICECKREVGRQKGGWGWGGVVYQCAPGVYVGYTIDLLSFTWLISYVIGLDIAEHNCKEKYHIPVVKIHVVSRYCTLYYWIGIPDSLEC